MFLSEHNPCFIIHFIAQVLERTNYNFFFTFSLTILLIHRDDFCFYYLRNMIFDNIIGYFLISESGGRSFFFFLLLRFYLFI